MHKYDNDPIKRDRDDHTAACVMTAQCEVPFDPAQEIARCAKRMQEEAEEAKREAADYRRALERIGNHTADARTLAIVVKSLGGYEGDAVLRSQVAGQK